MRNILLKCPKCHSYSMDAKCPKCGEGTVIAAPAKYSPDDKYARYRSPLAYQRSEAAETA